MDMQGTPIGSTNQGMKNTSDPRSNDPIREGAGGIASDSLAAESIRSGGGFAENRGAQPSGVSGGSSTWNTTDTSNARLIDPVRDASSRDDEATDSKYPEQLGGQPKFPGGHNADGYVGGPTGYGSGSSGGSGGVGSGSGSGSGAVSGGSGGSDDYSSTSDSTDQAPSYTLAQTGAYTDGKPKGSNLTEGGFSGQGSNYTSDVGGRNDPGREALKGFERSNARADPGSISQTGGIDNEQPYDALKRDERA